MILETKIDSLINNKGKGLSIIDNHIMYGKADKKIARVKLIDEINQSLLFLNITSST
jgi:hypothetical protein